MERLARAIAAAVVVCVAGAAHAGDGIIEVPAPGSPSEDGFHLEGAAQVAMVFGDVRTYRFHVNRFFALDREMDAVRQIFGRQLHAALAELSAVRGCPVAKVAPHVVAAAGARKRFEELGAELAARHRIIRQLDDSGDSGALTPGYRRKVNLSRTRYRQTLADLREMRASQDLQLARALRHRGCDPVELARVGLGGTTADSTAALNPMPPARARYREQAPAPALADEISFFVDNRGCPGPLSVIVNGSQLGDVAAHGRGAFRALTGRHSMCLLPKGAAGHCGQQGTVRSVFVYDGWSVTLRCPK